MNDSRLPLVLRLFPDFRSPTEEEGVDNLFRTSRLVASSENTRTLQVLDRKRPAFRNQSWIKEEIAKWGGGRDIILFVWADQSDLLAEISRLGTLDTFIPALRGAKKVLIVPAELWRDLAISARKSPEASCFVAAEYPLFVLRMREHYRLETAVELGTYLGVRRPSSAAIEAVRPGVERKDTRRDDEDDRPTIDPPPPVHVKTVRSHKP